MILLDTHVVVWLAQDYERFPPKARTAIQDARRQERGLAVSCISPIEVAWLASHGRIHLTPNAETVLAEVENRLIVLPITRNIALQAFDLPERYPKDPARSHHRCYLCDGRHSSAHCRRADPAFARGPHNLVEHLQ